MSFWTTPSRRARSCADMSLSELADLLSRIPPMWIVTFLLAAWSCVSAARHNRGRDAFLLLTLLLSCLFCVIYLCVAGDVL